MDYSKMDTMTKLILTCTLQFCVLFSYKALCLSHDRLPLYSGTISLWLCSMYKLILSMTSGYCHKVDETCTLLGYYTVSSGNL